MEPLRAVFSIGGVIATAAGLHTAATGARSILGGGGAANPAVESELRFYSAFYAAYGVAMLRAAPRAARDPATVRALAAPLFAAGLARAAAWRAVGRPHAGQMALLAIELAGPPAVVVWQARDAG